MDLKPLTPKEGVGALFTTLYALTPKEGVRAALTPKEGVRVLVV